MTTTLFFQLLPGEKVQRIVGMPGPDLDDCEVVSQDGDKVTIRGQVWGRGPVYEDVVNLANIVWKSGSATSDRFAKWQEATSAEYARVGFIVWQRRIYSVTFSTTSESLMASYLASGWNSNQRLLVRVGGWSFAVHREDAGATYP